jgi:predicted transcriptional regulator of viral defense system
VALPPPRPLGDAWDELGVETVRRQGLSIRVTGSERTLVDCLDRPRYSGGLEELFACVNSLPSLDFDVLAQYLSARGSPTLYARTGFVLQRFAERLFVNQQLLDHLALHLPKASAYLLRREPGNVLVPQWRLLVPPALLREEESPLR